MAVPEPVSIDWDAEPLPEFGSGKQPASWVHKAWPEGWRPTKQGRAA